MFVDSIRRHGVAVFDLIWPPFCPNCGSRAACPREHWCERCWARLAADRGDREPAPAGTPVVYAAWRVDALFLEMLATSKYRGRRDVGLRLARESAGRLARRLPAGFLVPVPLTRAKRRERGFNQPEDFARELSQIRGMPVRSDWLRRRRGGASSAGRRRAARADAVRDAFVAGPELPRDQKTPVILVDDVVTTGATTAECILALAAAGARVAAVVAMGRARDPADDAPLGHSDILAGW